MNVLFPPAPLPPALPLPPVDITMGDAAAPGALDPDGMDPTLKKRDTHNFGTRRSYSRSFVFVLSVVKHSKTKRNSEMVGEDPLLCINNDTLQCTSVILYLKVPSN